MANLGQLSLPTTMSTKQNTFFCRTQRFKEADKHAYLYGVSWRHHLSEGPSTNNIFCFFFLMFNGGRHPALLVHYRHPLIWSVDQTIA